MKSVDSKIYDKNYYLTKCLGSSEFKSTKGSTLHPRVKALLRKIPLEKNQVVLDIGCGRGDITRFLAKKVNKAYGIDYSKDAIKIAVSTIKKSDNNLFFKMMNAKKLDFHDNSFDLIVSIDVFEHLYKDELEIAMSEIKRVLKPEGILFVDTNTNKWLYDITYKYYIRPVNLFLTKLDMLIKNKTYQAMQKDPRIEDEKVQHVNEPTYYYLKDLFKRHKFKGVISTEIGYLKNGTSMKTYAYNFVSTLYPISNIFPLNLFFAWTFICLMKNNK